MKKTILICSLLALIFACNNSNETAGSGKPATATAPSDPEAEKGLALVAKSDCTGCHQISQPGIGPAYEAVANRYQKNEKTIDTLAMKIVKGGAGNWGSIPMAAHPQHSMEEARLMARYVLSLKQ